METKNRKATFKEEQETLKRIGAKLELDKKIEAVLKKELPELLKEAYNQNLSKKRAIEIIKETINKRKTDLTASYGLDVFTEICTTEDIDKMKELEILYLKDYKFLNDFETRLIDYIDKNYKEQRHKDGN